MLGIFSHEDLMKGIQLDKQLPPLDPASPLAKVIDCFFQVYNDNDFNQNAFVVPEGLPNSFNH